METYFHASMHGLRMLYRLGFDRVWFAMAVILSLFIASRVATLMLHWLAPVPVM